MKLKFKTPGEVCYKLIDGQIHQTQIQRVRIDILERGGHSVFYTLKCDGEEYHHGGIFFSLEDLLNNLKSNMKEHPYTTPAL